MLLRGLIVGGGKKSRYDGEGTDGGTCSLVG